MIQTYPSSRQFTLSSWLTIAVGMVMVYFLSKGLLVQGDQQTIPLSLVVGISTGFLVYYGWKSIFALVVGQLAISYLGSRGRFDWLSFFVTFFAILVVWEASLIVNWIQKKNRSHGLDMQALVSIHLGIPFLVMTPYAWARAEIFVKMGKISVSAFVPMLLHTLINSVLSMLLIGGVTFHLLRGDFRILDWRREAKGFFTGVFALGLLFLAFLGKFNSYLISYLAIFLPFPLLVITAVWLAPAWTSLIGVLWCFLSVTLTCFGYGPFVFSGAGTFIDASVGLGFYNIMITSVGYLVSLGSSRLTRQLDLNEIALSAAGIELWEWDCRRGFASLHGRPAGEYLQTITAGLVGEAALHRLKGTRSETTKIDDDTWRSQILKDSCKDMIFGSAGRILQRSFDQQPIRAIGLLQNLTAEKRAEAAIIEFGHQKMQIRGMQAKLNPHFLFNSLNVIRALVHIDNEKADHAISSLSELLRANLRNSDVLLVRLGEELGPVRAFLQLAELRFGDRLKTRIQVSQDFLDIKIPPMLLLNLVENAITHGIGALGKGGFVAIEASSDVEQVRISVQNTGTLSEDFRHGIGTRDVKQRLELLFGAHANFTLSQKDTSTVVAEITLPARHHFLHPIDPLYSSLS